MRINRLLLTIGILAVMIAPAIQAQRWVPPKRLIDQYRRDGELRLWTFMKSDSTIGQLRSVVQGVAKVNGVEAYRIHGQLLLDYSKIGENLKLAMVGDNFFDENGVFVGCDFSRKSNGQSGRVVLQRKGDTLSGFTERGKTQTPSRVMSPSGGFAIDYDMPDQYELYFAMHGLKVGDVINDSVVVPSDLSVVPLKGTVTRWQWEELWKGVYDSVFIVEMTSPVRQELFINRQLRLRKINIPSQKTRIYLDAVRAPRRPGPPTTGPTRVVNGKDLFRNYAVYLIVALIGVGLFIGRFYRRMAPYLGMLAGLGLTILVLMGIAAFNYTQGRVWLIYLLVYMPSVLFYAILLGLLAISSRLLRYGEGHFVAMAAAIGAGIGLGMGGYVDLIASPDQSLAFGQVLNILLYVGGGGLLGWAWTRSRRTILLTFLGVSAVSAALTTVRLLFPRLSGGLNTILLGVAAAGLLLATIVVQRRYSRKTT